jgi:hypothetical protein
LTASSVSDAIRKACLGSEASRCVPTNAVGFRQMARALEELSYLSRQEPTHQDFEAFQAEINAEKNDRGAAILLACNVEICLRIAIERNLTVESGGDIYRLLFHSGSPMRSFEAKIRAGYGMGLYGDQTKSNLDCIKGIRNAFAYALVPINFETPQVKAVCDTMQMPEICFPRALSSATMEPGGALHHNATTRQKFQKICEAISHNLFVFGSTICKGIPSDPQVGARVLKTRPRPLP